MARGGRQRNSLGGLSPVSLYSGEILIGEESSATARGRIRLAWQPAPRIEFEATGPRGLTDALGAVDWDVGGMLLSLPSIGGVRANPLMIEYGRREKLSGTVRPITVGDQSNTLWIDAKMVNLSIRNSPSVLSLHAEGWTLVLSDLAADPMDSPRDPSTFVVTQKVRLFRADDAPFNGADGLYVLDAFNHYASLCRGAWTGYMLPVGRGTHARTRWRRWEVARVDPSGVGAGWAIRRNDGLGPFNAMWPGFLARWRQDGWQATLRTLIALAIEGEAHTEGEAALLVEEVVLELLSWAVIVSDQGMVSPEGHDRLGASDRLRLMLALVGHDRAMPKAGALSAAASKLNWVDGPHAITEVRNLVAHPHQETSSQRCDRGGCRAGRRACVRVLPRRNRVAAHRRAAGGRRIVAPPR